MGDWPLTGFEKSQYINGRDARCPSHVPTAAEASGGGSTAKLEDGVLMVEIPRRLGYLWLKIDGIGK